MAKIINTSTKIAKKKVLEVLVRVNETPKSHEISMKSQNEKQSKSVKVSG